MSGKRVMIGDAMTAVIQGVDEVRTLIGQPPVVVGGLAVMRRLSDPYRATTDLDVVDRLLGEVPQLQVLRAARGAEPVDPTVLLARLAVDSSFQGRGLGSQLLAHALGEIAEAWVTRPVATRRSWPERVR